MKLLLQPLSWATLVQTCPPVLGLSDRFHPPLLQLPSFFWGGGSAETKMGVSPQRASPRRPEVLELQSGRFLVEKPSGWSLDTVAREQLWLSPLISE